MRKLLLSIAILLPFCGMAQKYCMIGQHSSDGLESSCYMYGNDNELISYETYDASDQGSVLQLRDTLEYDANGDCVKINNYQLISGIWKHTWYVDYTYDANHNRLSRENYNSFDGGVTFDLGGRYEYTYENDRIVSYVMYFVGTEFEHGTYSYNAQGLLTEIIVENNDPWGGTGWSYSAKTVYTYNDQNVCTRIDYYYYENGWVNSTSYIYTLDSNNNVITEEVYSANTLASRYGYAYDVETDLDDVIIPIDPEDTYNWDKFVNRPLGYSWEVADESGAMQFVCDYIFDYCEVTAVNSHVMPTDMLQVYPNPTEGSLTLMMDDIQQVVVMDMSGNTVMSSSMNGSNRIDLNGIASGLYIVKAYNGKTWSFGKVQVK